MIPIIEHIGSFLETAINEITVSAGYNYTLTSSRTKRFFLDDEILNDLTAYILQGKAESKGDVIETTAARIVRQQYLIWIVCLQSDDAEEMIDTKLNKVKSDVEKKLCEDHTCGGYCKFLDIISSEPTDTPETGILLTIEVLYSVQWNSPYIKK